MAEEQVENTNEITSGGSDPAAEPASNPAPESTASDPEPSAAEPDPTTLDVEPDAERDSMAVTWPDDWRARLANGDEEFEKLLKRFKSPESVAKKMREQEKLIRSGQHKRSATLPDDASDDEIAEFRKELGIPEESSGYKTSWAEGYEPTDVDANLLNGFHEVAHSSNMTPAQVQEAMNWYQELTLQTKQDMAANAIKIREDTQEELRREYGNEYRANITAAKAFMHEQLGGEDGARQLLHLQLADGSYLGDNHQFLGMMVDLGRDYVGPNAIYSGDIEANISTVQEEIDNINALIGTDDRKFNSPEIQEKLVELYGKKDKMNERKSRN